MELVPVRRVNEAVRILPAKPGELAAICALVRAVGLPPEGVAEALPYFWVAREGDTLVGTIGLEVYGELALLRSAAVAPAWQRRGLGSALTATVLDYAAARQFRALYLLTTTAADFFHKHGFVPVARAEVPAAVQQSLEFQSLCPQTAVCMACTLAPPPPPPSEGLHIRAARFADLPAIQEIHNQGIADRIATLDTELRDAAETRRWFEAHGPRHPVLVAEQAGEVVGWASLNAFKPRPAYQYVADLSIYVARPWRGKGIGTRLLETLLPLARQLEYHKVVLSAFPFNTVALRLYRRLGFRTVGVYREMGLLDGRWVDTVIMEKLLGDEAPRA